MLNNTLFSVQGELVSMSKNLLLGVIIILLITNIATLLIWRNEGVNVGDGRKLSSNDEVAIIGNDDISFAQWSDSLRNNYGKKHLRSMIDQAVVQQLAADKGLKISDKVIAREIAMLTTMQGVTSASTYEKLEKQWEEDITYRYQLEMLLTEGTPIPEQEIKNHYNTYGDQYNFTSSMQISHIVVDNMETANKVYQELESGASFKLLAREYSIDESSKAEGGYLGFIYTTSQFFPNGYAEVAENIEEHSYSKPFVADDGVVILYLHRKLPSITFTYEEMKPYIKSELALHKQNQSLDATPLWEEMEIDWLYGEE